MNEGFIKIDRKLLKWGWKDVPEMVALWIEILLQANYQDGEWHGKKYERGSFPTSVGKLAKATGLSLRQVRTGLERLKQSGEITVKSTSHGTKINVVKWAEYQDYDDNSDKQPTSQRQASDKQPTTLKERKKERRKEYIYINTRSQEETEVYDTSKNPEITEEQREAMRRRRA